jgi:hypothetical protein
LILPFLHLGRLASQNGQNRNSEITEKLIEYRRCERQRNRYWFYRGLKARRKESQMQIQVAKFRSIKKLRQLQILTRASIATAFSRPR